MWWGFEYLLKKFSKGWGKPPRLIVARGAQWSRDSARDYKVVGGKVIELMDEEQEPGDPDGEDSDG